MKHYITCISCIIFLIGDTLGADDTILNKLNRYISYISIVKYLLTLLVFCIAYCAQAQLRLDSVFWRDAQLLGGSNIIIQSDSNYYISWSNCYETEIAFGRWYIHKDTLILKAATDTNWTLIKSVSYKKRQQDSFVRISIKDTYGHGVEMFRERFLHYNNEKVYDGIITVDGYVDIPINAVIDVIFSYFAFSRYVLKTIPISDNDIEIVFNPCAEMLDRGILLTTTKTDEKYIIKKDGLYYIDNPIERAYVY